MSASWGCREHRSPDSLLDDQSDHRRQGDLSRYHHLASQWWQVRNERSRPRRSSRSRSDRRLGTGAGSGVHDPFSVGSPPARTIAEPAPGPCRWCRAWPVSSDVGPIGGRAVGRWANGGAAVRDRMTPIARPPVLAGGTCSPSVAPTAERASRTRHPTGGVMRSTWARQVEQVAVALGDRSTIAPPAPRIGGDGGDGLGVASHLRAGSHRAKRKSHACDFQAPPNRGVPRWRSGFPSRRYGVRRQSTPSPDSATSDRAGKCDKTGVDARSVRPADAGVSPSTAPEAGCPRRSRACRPAPSDTTPRSPSCASGCTREGHRSRSRSSAGVPWMRMTRRSDVGRGCPSVLWGRRGRPPGGRPPAVERRVVPSRVHGLPVEVPVTLRVIQPGIAVATDQVRITSNPS